MIHKVILLLGLILSNTGFGQQLINVSIEQNITEFQDFQMSNANGMSFYDFDEDGWDDLTYPMNNDSIIFYKNNGGQFEKVESFLLSEGNIRQISWVDYDNNGTLDICITYDQHGLKLYKNLGDFVFEDVSTSSGVYPSVSRPYGFSFVDYDLDNDLDIYLTNYESPGLSEEGNMFFENQGNGTFIEKASELAIDNGIHASFMGVWFDYNNDNLVDLHVINDRAFGNDALFRNSGNGIFSDVSGNVGLLNSGQNPMTSSISDYNNDGFQDIFVTDFGVDSIITGAGPFHHKLFENQEGVLFVDKALEYEMAVNDFGWGALWVDYDNDMYEDLYIATGDEWNNTGNVSHSILYKNNNGFGFSQINDSVINTPKVSFCPLKGDINNDGFYDIAVLNMDTIPDILLNQGNLNNYIKITPVGIESNRMAIGSEIRLFTNGTQQLQTVFCGEQLFAQNSQHKIFGLGNNEIIDSIHVNFPSGLVAKRYQVPANQSINIYEEIYTTSNFDLIEEIDSVLLCLGDSLFIELSNYENYQWSTGSQDSSILITSPGTYYFMAFNAAGDTLYRSNDLVVQSEEAPLLQFITEEVNCNDEFSGTATLLFANPAFIDSIYWSNGDTGMSADSLFEASNHWYTFITNNLCSYNYEFSITSSELFNVQFITSGENENEQGSISIFVFGGTPPFTYILEGDTVESYIDGLNAGLYELLVTDAYGCSEQVDISIQNMVSISEAEHDNEIDVKLTANHIEICALEDNVNELDLYDLRGKKVLHLELKQENLITCKKFNFVKPSGMYFAIITDINGLVHRRRVYKP